MRILLIEDDKNISTVLLNALRAEGFTCDSTDTGEDALQLARLYEYDAILLDLMLPDMDGMELLRRFRSSKNNTPTIILSGLNGVSEKIRGLSAGADDYIEKPYNQKELIARLHTVVRRYMGYSDSKITLGRISINLQTKTAKTDGIPLKLTSKEYAILELLMLKKGHMLSKEAFLTHLYDESSNEPAQKIVDVFICKLRKKLQNALESNHQYIETIWGRGYMLVNPETEKSKVMQNAN
jgi:two-component system cell cycle response regulator CtrA